MEKSNALKRVERFGNFESGIWLTINQLRELATHLEANGNLGVAFMMGKTASPENEKSIEILPFSGTISCENSEISKNLSFTIKDNLIGQMIVDLAVVKDGNCLLSINNNGGGGGGGNQKTPIG